jgi:hypothetical protein
MFLLVVYGIALIILIKVPKVVPRRWTITLDLTFTLFCARIKSGGTNMAKKKPAKGSLEELMEKMKASGAQPSKDGKSAAAGRDD